MFYDKFEALCRAKGVKPGRACLEMGLSRSLAAKWKATETQTPSTEVLSKVSAYFGVPMDRVLSGEKKEAPAGEPEGAMEAEFAALIRQLTDGELALLLAQMKGIVANRGPGPSPEGTGPQKEPDTPEPVPGG